MKSKITRETYREFFMRQMDRLLNLELLTQNQKGYWNLTISSKNYFNTNLMLLEKIDLYEVWESIPTRLKICLELFYNFKHNNITIEEVYKKVERGKFWILVDYGCLLFYENYFQKNLFRKEAQDEDNN